MDQASIELTGGARRPAALRLLSDDRLARRAAEGDRGAFAVIFERHHQGLYRYCRAILRHDEDARDALQTAFVRAIAALDGDERTVAIKPWLYRIAHNEAISLLRRRRPHDTLDTHPEPLSVSPGPDDRIIASERMRQLLIDLEQLPERQRWALLLRELNDLAYVDIAAALQTTEQAARQSVYEARVMLMELQEGREMPCEDVRRLISERDGRLLRPRRVRAHLKACDGCSGFRTAISERRSDLGVLAPPLPAAAAAAVLSALLGAGGGGGWGGGGLIAALGAGKGIVAGAGSKGLATAAALTIAGGAIVTTDHDVPPKQSGPRGAAEIAAAGSAPRAAATNASPLAVTFSYSAGGPARVAPAPKVTGLEPPRATADNPAPSGTNAPASADGEPSTPILHTPSGETGQVDQPGLAPGHDAAASEKAHDESSLGALGDAVAGAAAVNTNDDAGSEANGKGHQADDRESSGNSDHGRDRDRGRSDRGSDDDAGPVAHAASGPWSSDDEDTRGRSGRDKHQQKRGSGNGNAGPDDHASGNSSFDVASHGSSISDEGARGNSNHDARGNSDDDDSPGNSGHDEGARGNSDDDDSPGNSGHDEGPRGNSDDDDWDDDDSPGNSDDENSPGNSGRGHGRDSQRN